MSNVVSRWFSFSVEKDLAREMSIQVAAAVSAKLMSERRRVLSAKKVSNVLEGVYEKAQTYKAAYKPGAIRRAILANNFKWALKEAGYPEDFIDVATEGLVLNLQKKYDKKNKRQ